MSAKPVQRIPHDGYPRFRDFIPDGVLRDGAYTLRFARSQEELEAIERLRFEVFNLELKEGLDVSYDTGKDEDAFDQVCHHILIYRESVGVVGTYRLQTAEMAVRSRLGFYSASEFDLSTLPDDVRDQGVELGRACIAKDHRSLKVLYLLWKGIGLYLTYNQRRFLFGCTSLTSQDVAEGHAVFGFFKKKGHLHPSILVQPHANFICGGETILEGAGTKPKVPRLMRVYLSLGAKVCSPPAIDRMFKTIDYFTLFDTEQLNAQALAYFMPQR